MKKIQDEFSDLDISAQQKWILRQRKKGLCIRCSRPAKSGGLCEVHIAKRHVKQNEPETIDETRTASSGIAIEGVAGQPQTAESGEVQAVIAVQCDQSNDGTQTA